MTTRQLEALEIVLNYVKSIRADVKEYGEDCDVADSKMGLISMAEELYLTFGRERKKYM